MELVVGVSSIILRSGGASSSFETARKGNGPKIASRQFDADARLRNGLLNFAQTQFNVGIPSLE